jgi:hypothetical protein
MDETNSWYLLKHEDGALFGPIAFEQLQEWATEAQISPQDRVSQDNKSWVKAPMLAGLHMDYLIEVSPDQFYGPTTIGAVREFYFAGEIDGSARITNCRDGSESLLGDIPEILEAPHSEHGVETADANEGGAEGAPSNPSELRFNLQQRILELEEALLEERHARQKAEHLVSKLELQIAELTQSN